MRHFRPAPTLIAALAALCAVPAQAQNVRDPDVRAQDIPMQPLRDLNLDGEDIPPLLIDVANDPYSSEGLQTCAHIEGAIADLDAMLGEDFDLPQADKSDVQEGANSVGRIAKSFIGGLIPFRSVVRELSGARGKQRRKNAMISAALVRRGFLKGIGMERDCAWPARPADGVVKYNPSLERTPEPVTASAVSEAGAPPVFVSRPVVQGEP